MSMQSVKHLRWITGLCLLLFFFLYSACGGDEETRFRLTSRERIKVDTLYKRSIDSLRTSLDSYCIQNHDQFLKWAVDSILAERKATEVELRKRIPKPEN